MTAKRRRSRNLIRAWLIRNNKNVSSVAELSGVDISVVSRAMNGENNNRRVLRALVALGCPTHLLALPADMLPGKAV